MKSIDVFSMARSGASQQGELALASLPRLSASLLRCDGRLAYDCRCLIDACGRPAMELWLQAQLPLRCDRCAQELVFALSVRRSFYFVASEEQLAATEIDDAPEEALLGSAHFDLAGLIEDEAILQLPISPRHECCTPAVVVDAVPTDAPRPKPFAQLQGLREALRGQASAGGPAQALEGNSGSGRPKTRRTSR